MQKLVRKIHHFTQRELAAEEVIVILIICFLLAAGSLAASVLLPMRVNLVQCGHREDLPRTCRDDQRCCVLLEQSGGKVSIESGSDPEDPDGFTQDDPANFGSTEDIQTGKQEQTVFE